MEEEIRAEFQNSGFSIGGASPEDAAQILSTRKYNRPPPSALAPYLVLSWCWFIYVYMRVVCVVLLAVLTYCINYKMSPADLVSNWEVYYLNRSACPR